MKSPYQILGIDQAAGDEQIRQAYLERVKECPPEQDPEQFQAIQQAYEQIKDQQARLAYELFHLPSLEEYEQLLHQLHPRRPSLSQFRTMLVECLKRQQHDD